MFDMCAFGTSYKTPTRLAGTVRGLEILGRRYTCCFPQCGLVEIGVGGKWGFIWKTSLAGKHPPLLCRAAAELVADALNVASGVAATTTERWWDDRLAIVHGQVFTPPHPTTPSCPARWRCEWANCRRSVMCVDSRERRLTAIRAARAST